MSSSTSLHSFAKQVASCTGNPVSSTSNDSGFDAGDSSLSEPHLVQSAAGASRSSSVEVLNLNAWSDQQRCSVHENFPPVKERGEEGRLLLLPCETHEFCGSSSAVKGSLRSGCFSNSSSSIGRPLCRICHLLHDTTVDPMITPCRCSGTMQFVHTACLVHWLEISAKKMYPSPRCELCGYNYKRRKCIDPKRLHLPHIALRDMILNVVFLIVFIVMIVCAALCVRFLRITDQYHVLRPYNKNAPIMTGDDLIVLTCSVLFFTAFFIAIFTQYRAEASVFRVIFRFWLINRNWRIRSYEPSEDVEMAAERQARAARGISTENSEPCAVPC